MTDENKTPATETLTAPEGWTVYHREDAGAPELHTDGEWYYEPTDCGGGEVYSPGYATREEAVAACRAWTDTLAIEEG